jgi:hypothetical protein
MSKEKSILFINYLYQNLTYGNVYAPYIILNIILIGGLVLYIAFINVMKNVKYYKDNWDAEKCNPTIMPFAGFINKPDNKTIFQYTGENFQYCIQNVIQGFAGAAIDPFYYIVRVLTELYSIISEIVNTIRGVIDYIRSCLSDIFGTFLGKIVNIVSSIIQILNTMRDILTRSLGSLVLSYYFIQSVFLTTFAALGTFAEVIIGLLVAISVFLALLIILVSFNPINVGLWITIALYGLAYVLIAVPIAYIIYLNSTLPKTGTCFDKNTLFQLSNGNKIPISQLKIGDILEDGSIINCHLTLDASNEIMYKLNNIIVSGTHPVLYNNQWILVSSHPNVEKIINYTEKYIYCLNTSNKKIIINNIIFSDWDDVFNENRYEILLKNIQNKHLNNIHKYYDKGFSKSTLIKMADGSFKKISEIKVGDFLDNFIKVYGIVHIKSDDLINGNLINSDCEKDLGKIYNLLTDKSYFYINDLKYNDYNYCIDRYL